MVCLVLPSATIYAFNQMNPRIIDNEDNNMIPDDTHSGDMSDIERIALDYLLSCPTFSYDGITDSIKVLEKYAMESYPVQYVIVISFNTTHAGWGNRAGTFSAEVITPHKIIITIVENNVISAVIDDKWDELTQEQIIPEEFLIPERARDNAIHYLLKNYSELEDLNFPEVWITEQTTPEMLLGSSTFRYLSEGWNVTVQYAIVWHPDFNIDIEYSGSISFHWSGIVNSDGEVSEIEFNLK